MVAKSVNNLNKIRELLKYLANPNSIHPHHSHLLQTITELPAGSIASSPEVSSPSSSEVSASSLSSLRSRQHWRCLSSQIISSPSRSDFLIVMPFFSHRRHVPPPSLTPLLQIVALPSKSAIAPCRIVHFSPPPPLVTSSLTTTTTVFPILVSRALSERKSGISSINEHSDLSIWNRGEDNMVFTLYCNVFICFLLIVDSLLGKMRTSVIDAICATLSGSSRGTCLPVKGQISSYISKLTMLQYLDLSKNNLSRSVPDFVTQLQSLKVLNLGNNNLTGLVPNGLLDKSKKGSLSLSVERNPNLCASTSCNQQTCGTISNNKKSNNSNHIVISIAASIVGVLLYFKSA